MGDLNQYTSGNRWNHSRYITLSRSSVFDLVSPDSSSSVHHVLGVLHTDNSPFIYITYMNLPLYLNSFPETK